MVLLLKVDIIDVKKYKSNKFKALINQECIYLNLKALYSIINKNKVKDKLVILHSDLYCPTCFYLIKIYFFYCL